MALPPQDCPSTGLAEGEEVDGFGRVVRKTASCENNITVITTYTDPSHHKAKMLSLNGMLDYTEKDVSEKIFEVSLLAETFKDMIMVRFAKVIEQTFEEAIERRAEMQRLDAADAEASDKMEEEGNAKPLEEGEVQPVAPLEEGEIPNPEKKKEEEVKPIPIPIPISVNVDRNMYVACRYFDTKNKGYLTQNDLLSILLNANLVCSKAEAESITHQVVENNKFEYHNLYKALFH